VILDLHIIDQRREVTGFDGFLEEYFFVSFLHFILLFWDFRRKKYFVPPVREGVGG